MEKRMNMFEMAEGLGARVLSVLLAFAFVFSGAPVFAAPGGGKKPDTPVEFAWACHRIADGWEIIERNATAIEESEVMFLYEGEFDLVEESGAAKQWCADNDPNAEPEPIIDVNIEAPYLISPLNHAVVKGDVLVNEWSAVDGAVKYIYNSYHDEGATDLRWQLIVNAPATSKQANNVADATFWWRVKAVDIDNNESEWSELWKVTVDNSISDTTAPVVEVTSPTNNNILAGTIEIRGSVFEEEELSHYNISLYPGNADYNDFSQRIFSKTVYIASGFEDEVLHHWDTTTYADGEYLVRLAARDVAGNRDLTCDSSIGDVCSHHVINVVVDNTSPVVEITHPVDGSTVNGTIDVRGTVEDENLWRYYTVVLDSSNKKVAGPGTVYEDNAFEDESLFIWDTTEVLDGQYTIRLEARDKAGNKDSGSVHVITVTVKNSIEQEPANETRRPRGSSFSGIQAPDAPETDSSLGPVGPDSDIDELLLLLDGARLALLDLQNQLQEMLPVEPEVPLAETGIPPTPPATIEGESGDLIEPALAVDDEDAMTEDEEITPAPEETEEDEDSSQLAAAFMGISSSWLNLITRFALALAVSVGLYFGWAYFKARRKTFLK
jgi:hypothetical protein